MKRGRPKGKSTDKRSFGPLGDLIRKKRLEKNLGLLDVAKAVKCSVQFVSNIEHGRAPLPWEKAEKLSTYLEIPMDELQAANLAIRADFKSFMATSKGKKIAKASTALATTVKDAASVVAVSTQDLQLNDIIRLYQSAPIANRKKFYTEAKKLLEAL
jgi:transcriptional regulator with XRE-family HTH domain